MFVVHIMTLKFWTRKPKQDLSVNKPKKHSFLEQAVTTTKKTLLLSQSNAQHLASELNTWSFKMWFVSVMFIWCNKLCNRRPSASRASRNCQISEGKLPDQDIGDCPHTLHHDCLGEKQEPLH